MGKKLLKAVILVSILVFVVSLLIPGFSPVNSLSYESLQILVESISANADSITFDFALIRTLQMYIANFDFDADQDIIFTKGSRFPPESQNVPLPGDMFYTKIQLRTIKSDGTSSTIEIASGFALDLEKYDGLVSVFQWLNHDPCNGSVLTTVFLVVKTFVGFVVAVAFLLVYLIFDVISVVWCVLYGFMRLFGWVLD